MKQTSQKTKYNEGYFLLKGSSLLYALDGFKARPTIDMDLLGERISNDRDSLKIVFQKVCSVECEDDGVRFDADFLEMEPIAVEKKYPGTCVKVVAHLDTICSRYQLTLASVMWLRLILSHWITHCYFPMFLL